MKRSLLTSWALGLFLIAELACAQIVPFGLQSDTIVALTAEGTDYEPDAYGYIQGLQIFAATQRNGVHASLAFDTIPAWRPLGLHGMPLSALTVQHWGVGPRDGVHLFAAAIPSENDTAALVYRRDEAPFGLPDTSWIRADSGMIRGNAQTIHGLAAYYYTGHTPPQPVIAAMEHGFVQGSPGGYFWEKPIIDLAWTIHALDVRPLWFGDLAWAAGRWNLTPAGFWSTDKGSTWDHVLLPSLVEGDCFSVLIHPRNPDTVFIGSQAGIMYETNDGGKTWSAHQFSKPFTVRALAIDPQFPENMFAGGEDVTGGFALLSSNDAGSSWKEILPPAGRKLAGVTSLLFISADSIYPRKERLAILFIGTEGTGVWKLSPEILLSAEHAAVPADLRLSSFPTPASTTTTVTIDLPWRNHIHLRLYDVLGRERMNLHDGMLEAGRHSFPVNLGMLPEGVYFYELTARNIRVMQKLYIVK